MSWFVPHPERHPLSRFVMETTEPILKPVRQALPKLGMFDLSPIVVVIVLDRIVRPLLNSML
ncbi:MAG: YggT family protein [Oceanicoccus sp.]|jgi:YggT family protein